MTTPEENQKSLTERDICTKYITPALVAAGWDLQSQLREEVTFTAGRVIVRGSRVTRGEVRRADYVLYYKPGMPIAVIEAKDNNHSVAAGMQQALAGAEAAKHGDPDELLENYKELLTEVAAARDALKKELAMALESAK